LGKKGARINEIQESHHVKINILDGGRVIIIGSKVEDVREARMKIELKEKFFDLTAEQSGQY